MIARHSVLVVCKDGTARSGIFVMLDMKIEHVRTREYMKFIDIVRHLRQQRNNVLDTFEMLDARLNLIIELAKVFNLNEE